MTVSLREAVSGGYAGAAQLPSYDRSLVSTGIVHLGVGGFHRSHQEVYVDRLLSNGEALEWGITGVGVLPVDQGMRDVLLSQDRLYTVLMKDPNGDTEAQVVGAMAGYLFVPDGPDQVIELLASPATRILSMTITEGGYNLSPSTGQFDDDSPVIRAELAGVGDPRTYFRLAYEALRLRRDRNILPFTVMSCDNIQGNGDVARRTLVRYAELTDPEMARWIATNVRFPNSMVDRITPTTTDDDRRQVREVYGLEDEWPVPCEPFIQWVIEDNFSLGRPRFESVGVQLVDDVVPYEKMKLRLLNASHQVIAYFSFLSGHEYVHEAMSDPLIRDVVASFMLNEAQPTLSPVPGIDLEEYRHSLIERFSNPQIRDTIARQCLQTSTTIPNFLLPIIRDQVRTGGRIRIAVATVAAWACYAEENGDYQIVDRRRELIVSRAREKGNPLAFIEDESLFGDLSDDTRFRQEFRFWREQIRRSGISVTLSRLVR